MKVDWNRHKVPDACPVCGVVRLVVKYRKGSLCKRCSAHRLGESRKGVKYSPDVIAKRVRTNRERGNTERVIAALAIGNTGRKESQEHKDKIGRASAKYRASPETKKKIGDASRARWLNGTFKNVVLVGRGAAGKRADLRNQFFRSRWEANIARILEALGVSWEFEPRPFTLSNGKVYIPDFNVSGDWLEVKGYMRSDDQEKIDAFRKDNPDKKLIVIDQVRYRELEREWKPRIPKWE